MNYKKQVGAIFSIILLIILSGCSAKKKTDLQNLSLQGKVKQVIELQYLAVERFGKPEKGNLYRAEGWDLIMEFNEQGYFTKMTHVDPYGKEVGYTDYLYNEQNELVSELNYDSEGGFIDRTNLIYDEKRRLYETVTINSNDGISGSMLVDYDDKENKVTESVYNHRGMLLQKEIRWLDKKGLPVETRIFGEDNNLINYRKEKFDKNGLRSELTVISPDEEVIMNITFKYDKKENLILQEGTDEEGKAFLPVRYTYEFDKQGNWIKRVEYMGDRPTFILERQFDYYE